ncbi:GspH/FimT family pseudopilin [Variovorax paradoxus]|uniref:pilus assembly FimT family protein n=1 Tax=Variovorax paradoxus TaxID=34073 RepID=UPI00247911F2
MVTITLLSILLAVGVPSMSAWIRNNKIRTVTDSLQNGLRSAQAEAARRSRQVVFSLTDDAPTSNTYTAKTNGRNWVASTVALLTSDDSSVFIESGILRDAGSGVVVTGPKSICFSSIGRTVINDAPGPTGAKCEAAPYTFDVKMSTDSADDRPLRVTVALGGQVRMCDPKRSLSSSQPDGCP